MRNSDEHSDRSKFGELSNLAPVFGDSQPAVKNIMVMAGPCSAESRCQVLETARGVADCGVRVYRAGVWKPRTRPGSFEGMGVRALPWLAEVREKTGMIPMTEVATPAHLRCALRSGIDAFWIGARTSANPFAVQEIADFLTQLPGSHRDRLTFFVKNPVNPDLELWIGALQRLYGAGLRRLGAIHRGFSTYGASIYRNLPEWRIPIELKRRVPKLPVICDPSHIGGRRDLILPISQQVVDMNFDGLIVETHCDPDSALSDSAQQLMPSELSAMLAKLRTNRNVGSDGSLEALRSEIDRIDDDLVALLSKRMEVAAEIGKLKMRSEMSVVQPERYEQLMVRRVAECARLGLSEDFMRTIFSTIHEESVRRQILLRK